jgi:hypothetical protein
MDRDATRTCDWCGADVEVSDGFRAYEPAGARRATFCRLEHVVPWGMQGPHWQAGEMSEPAVLDSPPLSCAHCGAEVGEVHVLLVRHRGEHRVGDAFCSLDHMVDWAKAGGRWRAA